MRHLHRLRARDLAPLALAALLAAGCGGGDATDAGFTGESATLVGELRAEGRSVPESLDLSVDGDDRTVSVGPDRQFTTRGVPTGDTEVVVATNGIRARVTLTDVQPGEIIELDITVTPDSISIDVSRRSAAPPPAPDPFLPVIPGDIEITRNNATFQLEPATYTGDIVIRGNNVRLVGYYEGVCDPALLTVVEGRVEIRGNNATLVDVYVAGDLDVRGNNFEAWRSCSGPGVGF